VLSRPLFLVGAGQILVHQGLLPRAVQRDKGAAAPGAVDRVGFRKRSMLAREIAELHGSLPFL
jgi:hypothetical protein